MKEELRNAFNENVHRYRNTLLYCAKKCDWDTFKLIAGRLFDYIETVERAELRRRFFRSSGFVVAVMFCMVVFILALHPNVSPEIERLKRLIFFAALGAGGFEFFFYMNFHEYMKRKAALYKLRKDYFVRGVEKDFRDMCLAPA